MLAAVSRDESMLAGGLSSGKWTGRGTVVVEPLARLSESGEWRSLPCDGSDRTACLRFAREYLSSPHTYRVVSAGGRGAVIHAAPTTLSECYDFSGTGTYSGAPLTRSAIAAASEELFEDSAAPRLLHKEERAAVSKALSALVPERLDSTRALRYRSLSLGGDHFVVVERSLADLAAVESGRLQFIFAIGTVSDGVFKVIHWKENTEDEQERLLGKIRIKSGREFLITVVNDPEGHWFRVYGVRNGRLTLVYSGGGSSC